MDARDLAHSVNLSTRLSPVAGDNTQTNWPFDGLVLSANEHRLPGRLG